MKPMSSNSSWKNPALTNAAVNRRHHSPPVVAGATLAPHWTSVFTSPRPPPIAMKIVRFITTIVGVASTQRVRWRSASRNGSGRAVKFRPVYGQITAAAGKTISMVRRRRQMCKNVGAVTCGYSASIQFFENFTVCLRGDLQFSRMGMGSSVQLQTGEAVARVRADIAEGRVTTAAEAAEMLDHLLPIGAAGVPGGLRYAIDRKS